MDWKTLFFSPEGRIGRQAFWIGWLCLFGAFVVTRPIPFVDGIAFFVIAYAWVCIHTKRLHDMGQTGWWQLLPIIFGPVLVLGAGASVGISAIMAAIHGGEPDIAVLAALGGLLVSSFIAFAVWLAFTLWVGFSTGQTRENKYGAEPAGAVAI